MMFLRKIKTQVKIIFLIQPKFVKIIMNKFNKIFKIQLFKDF